jgi:hypothetical protein
MPSFVVLNGIDKARLEDLLAKTGNKKRYKLGGKIRPLDVPPETWSEVDCSGFVRWLLFQITHGMTIPDGSFNQNHGWAAVKSFKPTAYNKDSVGLKDGRLRIAFMEPTRSGHGHVWLIWNGKTIESWGGHGPGRRNWNVKPLVSRVSACFVLTNPLS